MRVRKPSYWPEFRCKMGDCPDTCCRDWEVVLDDETRAFYETVPGTLGEELRAEIARGGDCFALDHALCPFLNGDGLCRIQLAVGEEHLTHNCASFPRFAEEYGALREWALALSCPEAARLILTAPAPAAFTLEKTDEPLTETNNLDAALFTCLLSARTALFALACDRTLAFGERLALTVLLASCVQKKLSRGNYAAASKAVERFSLEKARRQLRRCAGDPSAVGEILDHLRALEMLTPRYRALLDAARPDAACPADDAAWENLLVYFLYRYVLKAAVDGDLFGRVRAAVIGCIALRALMAPAGFSLETMIDIAHLYGREIEHDAENLAALVQMDFSQERLLAAILAQNAAK